MDSHITSTGIVELSHEVELGDLLIEFLESIGIGFIFGIPGGAIEPLFDAMARSSRRNGLHPVVSRHEAGAAFMADGYARETRKLGVCCATTGPGATNLITGLASAYTDNIPVLAITAQTKISHHGRRAFQESSMDAVDTVAMMSHCTCYSTMVTHPEQLEIKLATCVMTALKAQGPVHLSVPLDILRYKTRKQHHFPHFEQLLSQHELTDSAAIDTLCKEVLNARKICILIGAYCQDAVDNILAFAELLNTAVVTTPQGKPWINPYHHLYHGVFGFAGHKSAHEALADPEVDLIIAAGTSFGEWESGGWDKDTLMNNKLVHIDTSNTAFLQSPMARLHVCGNMRVIFDILIQRIKKIIKKRTLHSVKEASINTPTLPFPDRRNTEPGGCAPRHIHIENPSAYRRHDSRHSRVKPQRLMCELNQQLPHNARLLVDAGNSFTWSTHYLFYAQAGCYRLSMNFAAMTWAIGAAVGTAFGAPNTPVVCITGDGSYLMSGQELSVAVQYQLPIIFIILNDQALGMVKHGQRLTGAEQVAYELPAVDFCLMAQAVGAHAIRISTNEELAATDLTALTLRSGPTLLEVLIDGEEQPPMGMRAAGLRSASSSIFD